MMTLSTHPPAYADASPIGTAITNATPTDCTLTRTAIAAPAMIRLRMSRPRSSVPSQCAHDGDALRFRTSIAFGEYGSNQWPKSVHATTSARNASAIQTAGRESTRRNAPRTRERPAVSASVSTTAGDAKSESVAEASIPVIRPSRVDRAARS